MEKIPFKIEAKFEPAGDQPQAIEKLVEGVNDGLAHQTLLGVTGSGKSVGYDEPLLIAELQAGKVCTRLVKAGPFIDGMIQSNGLDCVDGRDTERYATADRAFLTRLTIHIAGPRLGIPWQLYSAPRTAANVSLGHALRT